jgi:flagellar basal-body rod protein FlgB
MRILDSIERLRAGLDYHLARHNLLTANLAHVDTPGYRPLDLQKANAGDFNAVMNTALVATDPHHIGTHEAANSREAFRVVEDPTATPGLDGNSVNVDREAVKIATNHVRYETLASLASSELAGLAWAANDGRSL